MRNVFKGVHFKIGESEECLEVEGIIIPVGEVHKCVVCCSITR